MNHGTRNAAVKGTFYPKICSELQTQFLSWNKKFKTPIENLDIKPRAIIVPHAGYIFSGCTANAAYRFLQPTKPKRIIVIGPSHYHHFEGISGSFYDAYETPCDPLQIDSAYLFALAKKFNLRFEPKAHEREHSTEVQMPMIAHYFSKTKVIELIYSGISDHALANLIIALLQNGENIVVISSDLSHFYPLNKAHELDNHCIEGIEAIDLDKLKGCEACGLAGIKAMVLASQQLHLSSHIIDYRTSAKTSGDTSSVVGYMSAVFY